MEYTRKSLICQEKTPKKWFKLPRGIPRGGKDALYRAFSAKKSKIERPRVSSPVGQPILDFLSRKFIANCCVGNATR